MTVWGPLSNMSFGSDAPQLAVDPKVLTKFDPKFEMGIQGRPTTGFVHTTEQFGYRRVCCSAILRPLERA